jgi:hypothetical protein
MMLIVILFFSFILLHRAIKKRIVGQSQETNHPNHHSPVISQSNIAETSTSSSEQFQQHQVTQSNRDINQTLHTINNNNNNNNNNCLVTKAKNLNVDPQFGTVAVHDEDDCGIVEEQNNNNNNTTTSSNRTCYRHHPVSRRGTEFISPTVPGFRSYGNINRYNTQRNK